MGLLDGAKRLLRETFSTKGVPAGLAGGLPGRSPYADAYKRRAAPGQRQLLDDLRGFAYGCASLNANAFASVKLKCYVRQNPGEAASRWPTKSLSRREEEALRDGHPTLNQYLRKAHKLEEVLECPMLDVLEKFNPHMNQFDGWRMLSLDLDTVGEAYWYCVPTAIGRPGEIYPLEAWRTRVIPTLAGPDIIAGYEYSGARNSKIYTPDELIQFREISPHDPYATGYSPMRASFEYVELANELLAYESSVVTNRARPDMLISPKDPISRASAQRLEQRFVDRFRRGGAGGVMVGEHDLSYTPFAYSPVDLGIEAIRKACEESIAFCFRVPLSLIQIADSNRAVSEAGHYQHSKLFLEPRCRQIEQKLNEQFVEKFDGRFIVAFDNPVPQDRDRDRQDEASDLQCGLRSINEIRQARGFGEIPGGDEPLVDPNRVPLSRVATLSETLFQQRGQAGQRGEAKTYKVTRRQVARIVEDQMDRARLQEGPDDSFWFS